MTLLRLTTAACRFARQFARDTSGAVAIEFMLIAPILLALILGIITLGFYMGVSHSVHQLAAGAARASVAGLDETERRDIATTYLAQGATRYPLLKAEALTSSLDYSGTATGSITVNVTYAADGTLLDVANGFLNLGIETIRGRAYVAY
ncbi:TadE/TadG family type IV pilus assembly protein [Roseovarius sp.]|uniref:TadE/TadG family type IV pilus assembly protein n=1 Tax=Roseovarius sp. TaxID=1486281 RepID=UPI003B5C2381